jgi:hypothetical protein
MRLPLLDRIAVVGLLLGAVFGMLGTVVSRSPLRQAFWAIDGVGLVVAAALLSIRFFRRGNDLVAVGFLIFTIAESLLISGTAAGLEGSVPSFAGGTILWSTSLFFISVPRGLATWVRAAGTVAAVLFGFISMRIFLGEMLLPTDSPLPFFAYPFLVLTLIGWIWTLVTDRSLFSPAM